MLHLLHGPWVKGGGFCAGAGPAQLPCHSRGQSLGFSIPYPVKGAGDTDIAAAAQECQDQISTKHSAWYTVGSQWILVASLTATGSKLAARSVPENLQLPKQELLLASLSPLRHVASRKTHGPIWSPAA